MIDKDLHTALFELEKNLEDLSSAKQQIDEIKEISSNVISAISVLQDKYSNHLENLETTHLRKIETYKNTLNDFKTKLEKEHHKIISTSKDIINNAKNEFQQFIDYQKEEINKHHISLISSTKKIVTDTVEQLDRSISEHNEIFNNQDKAIKQHLDIYNNFLNKVNELLQYIDKVDFPSRLDKIDNTISSINIGIQNLQGIINDLQREQQKKIEYFEKLITENFSKINSRNEKATKKHQLYFIIIIILAIINIIIKFI